MKRLLPIALGLAASALTLFLLMPLKCQETVRGRIFINEETLTPCPRVSSRVGLEYSNDALGSWASNLAAAVVGISLATVLQRGLDRQTEEVG